MCTGPTWDWYAGLPVDSINTYAAEVRELEAKVLAEQQAVLQARAPITPYPTLTLPSLLHRENDVPRIVSGCLGTRRY